MLTLCFWDYCHLYIAEFQQHKEHTLHLSFCLSESPWKYGIYKILNWTLLDSFVKYLLNVCPFLDLHDMLK